LTFRPAAGRKPGTTPPKKRIDTMKVQIRDYRAKEGMAAFNLGYTGPNPYAAGSESAQIWAKGYAENKAASA
jgi:hypothetical protein